MLPFGPEPEGPADAGEKLLRNKFFTALNHLF